MKFKAFFLALSLVLVALIGTGTFAHGQTINFEFQDNEGKTLDTVKPEDTFFVVVIVDDAKGDDGIGVASAALTIEYDESIFEVDESNVSDSDYYFLAESDMFVDVVDNRDPDDPKTAVPCIGNKETPGEVLLSGAYVDIDHGGGHFDGEQDIFVVQFVVKEGAVIGESYTFTVKQTEILNLDAGWGIDDTTPEPIPVLVGAVDENDDDWEDLADKAFPVLLGNDDNPFIAVTKDITVVSGEQYKLTMAVTGTGSTTPAVGDHTYTAGTKVDITAIPGSGWQFQSWSGGVADPNSVSTTVTMDSDKTVTATFTQDVPDEYKLTMAVTGTGSTTPAVGDHTYPAGTEVDITAIPGSGWQFQSWSGGVADPNSVSTTVTMDSDKTVTATFTQDVPDEYKLTMAVTGTGSTTPAVGEHTYPAGTEVDITAIPGSGWQFQSWSGGVADPNSVSTTVTMDSDKTVTATFTQDVPDEYKLTMAVTGTGSTTPAVGEHTYPEGTEVDITATPGSGWQFESWTGGVADPDSATTTVTMDSTKTVTATFTEETPDDYTLTMAVTGTGSTTPAVGEHTYPEGTEVDITATPGSGWQFESWTGGVADPDSATTTVTMDSTKTVTATFTEETPDEYKLTMAVTGTGSTTPAVGDHTYTAGTEVDITAIPGSGWQFQSWSGGVADPNSVSTTVTMDSDKTVTATFTESGSSGAAFPFSEGFESGGLSSYWTPSSSGIGRIQVTALNGPASGSHHLTMDSSHYMNFALNELVLNINLAGQSGVLLRFKHKQFNDDSNVMPASFKGPHDSDGVAISADGNTWYKVKGLTSADGTSSAWQCYEVDLDAVVEAASIGYNSAFKIKFQQYGKHPIVSATFPLSNGFAFDDIELYKATGDPVDPGVAANFPFEEDFEDGALKSYWTTSSSGIGRIQVTALNGSASGTYHLTMDSSNYMNVALNELVLNIKLAGQSGVMLRFKHKEFNDDSNVMPALFKGSHNSDGVAISADGNTWYKVQGLTSADGTSSVWQCYVVDLDAAVGAAGIGYSKAFKIKFQQYGKNPIVSATFPFSDGFAFDDIEVR